MSSHRTDPNLFMTPDPIPPRTSDQSATNLGIWAFCMVLLCCLAIGALALWAGYLDRTTLVGSRGPDRGQIVNPDHPIDRDITVGGKVSQVISPTEFILSDTDRGDRELRVVIDSARTLPIGAQVRVTGRMQAPERSATDEESGDLPAMRLPVMHASQIEVAGEEPR